MERNTSQKKVIAFENYERGSVATQASERLFGIVFGALFLFIGISLHSFFYSVVWILLALFMLLAAWICPKILVPLSQSWMKLGFLLHRIMNPILMGVLFFGVLTPIALITKIGGRDPLRLKFDRNAKSYWLKRELTDQTDLNNQF